MIWGRYYPWYLLSSWVVVRSLVKFTSWVKCEIVLCMCERQLYLSSKNLLSASKILIPNPQVSSGEFFLLSDTVHCWHGEDDEILRFQHSRLVWSSGQRLWSPVAAVSLYVLLKFPTDRWNGICVSKWISIAGVRSYWNIQ